MATPETANPALDLWTRQPPGSRRPRYTLDQIAEAAVRLADSEGLDALSMRRLAAELGAGTMTLYHYVRNKDELLRLVNDRVMGELIVPADEFPSGWRDALTVIARRTRQALVRHPWMLDLTDDPALGPNGVRHFDQSLQAVAGLPLTLRDKLDVISTVDAYVFGYCVAARNDEPFEDRGAVRVVMDYTLGLARTGDYPQIAALGKEHGVEALTEEFYAFGADESRFDRMLARLLDGLGSDLPV